MKHNIKRILNLLLIAVLMMSITPATALSADNTDYVVTWEGDDLPNDNFNENSQYSAKGITATLNGGWQKCSWAYRVDWGNYFEFKSGGGVVFTHSGTKIRKIIIWGEITISGLMDTSWNIAPDSKAVSWNHDPQFSVGMFSNENDPEGIKIIKITRIEFYLEPMGISLTPSTAQTVNMEDTSSNVIEFTPGSITPDYDEADKTVKWSVSSSCVALYSDSNCSTPVTGAVAAQKVYAKVTAIGKATVTVSRNADPNITASCDVTVIDNAISGVITKINALPDTITTGDEKTIDEARAAYEALSLDEKPLFHQTY